jgi:hypothetical protein
MTLITAAKSPRRRARHLKNSHPSRRRTARMTNSSHINDPIPPPRETRPTPGPHAGLDAEAPVREMTSPCPPESELSKHDQPGPGTGENGKRRHEAALLRWDFQRGFRTRLLVDETAASAVESRPALPKQSLFRHRLGGSVT